MPPNYGTRQRVNGQCERVAQGQPNSITTRDIGMTKRVTASITFGGGQLTAANGTFSPFAVNDPIEVSGVGLDRGFYTVTAIDTVNASYLTVDPPPPAQAAVTCTVRTP
jgi:hypothetical protein